MIYTHVSEIPIENPGPIIEFGVAEGGSINRMADENPDRTLDGFDSFKGLPEDWGDRHLKGHLS